MAADDAGLHQSDERLFKAGFSDPGRAAAFLRPLSGRAPRLHLLFEHQTSRDPLLALRLLRYVVRIWEKHSLAEDSAPSSKLPVMLPIVLAQNAEARNVTPRFASLLDVLQLSLALRLVERKFPEAFAEAAPLIRALDGEGLLRFGEALLFMASAEDCLRWLTSAGR